MEFTAKLVVNKTNPKARIMAVGAFLLVISIFVSIKPKYEQYAYWGFGGSVFLILLGAVLAKGRITESEVSATDLVVNGWEIRAGDSTYRLDLVTDIEFHVDPPANTAADGSGGGTHNYLKFTYCGEELKYRFYMAGQDSVRRLASLYRDWYLNNVAFVERATFGGRTFMLEPVKGEKEVAERKKAAGYA